MKPYQVRITYIMYKIRKWTTCAGYARKRNKPLTTLSMTAPALRQARQDHFGLSKVEKCHGWTLRRILEYSRIRVIDLALEGKDSSNLVQT